MPTDAELLDLPPSLGVVTSGVVWDLLDRNLNLVRRLHPRMDSIPSVQVRAADTVKRTLSGFALTATEYAMIDAHSDRIRPSWVLSSGTQFPLGVFLFSQVTRKPTSAGVPMEGTLYDQTVILDQPRDTSLSLGVGASVDAAITQIVSGDGLGIPALSIPTSGAAVATPVSWAAGESRYKILSDLFTLANFYPPFFDNHGTLVGKPVPNGITSQGGWDHEYSPGSASRVIAETVSEADETITAPNRYLVLDNGPTQQPIVAWYDINSDWPHSYANRGFRVVEKVNVNGLTDNTAAYNAAVRAALVDLNSGLTTIDFDATPDPRHDVYAIVRYNGVSYRESGWSLKLQPGGPHSHTLSGIY